MKHHTSLFAGVFAAAVCLLPASNAQAAYGDLAADLVYTPVAPCRIADTRIAGGTLTANTARGFDVTAVSDYSFQGGEANNCAIGNAGSFAAVAVNITVINPNVSGSLKAFAFGATTPASAIAMSYAAGEVRSNFAVLKIDQGASANELSVVSTASAHLTIDVVGYFGALPGWLKYACGAAGALLVVAVGKWLAHRHAGKAEVIEISLDAPDAAPRGKQGGQA